MPQAINRALDPILAIGEWSLTRGIGGPAKPELCTKAQHDAAGAGSCSRSAALRVRVAASLAQSRSTRLTQSPGSRAGLLPPSPLRTARESFPSSSSSLSNAPCRTRWCHGQHLAMDLSMALGMQEDTVLYGILAPMLPPDSVMVVPPCKSGDLLMTHGTETVLLFPQGQELPSPFEGVCHLHAEACFEVHGPLGVIRVRCPFDLDMPLNGHVSCTKECEFLGLPLVTRVGPHEGPSASLACAEVFPRHPLARFLRMPPCGPRPQTLEDGCIHVDEGGLADHVVVIVGPAANHGVELRYQMARCGLLVRLHDLPDVPLPVGHIFCFREIGAMMGIDSPP